MKRKDLLKYLERHGCILLREGGKHTVYLNPETKQTTTIPRHSEIEEFLARKIQKDLGVAPKK